MIEFVLGFVFGISAFVGGLVAGFIIGSKQVKETIVEARRRMGKPPETSGPVKPYTRTDVEMEENKHISKVLNGLHQDDWHD